MSAALAASTRPVSSGAPDWSAVGEALGPLLQAREVRIAKARLMQGGAIQQNWAIEARVHGGPRDGTQAWVLRTDAASAVASSRSRGDEYALLCVVHRAGVPVPEPVAICEQTAAIGRAFFVMSCVPGVAAGHLLSRDDALVPDRPRLLQDLGVALARIHRLRPGGDLDARLGAAPANTTLELVARLRLQLDRLPRAQPAIEWGLRHIERGAPRDAPASLVHRDFRTGNYLVHAGRLAAVLDWEFADWGHPLEDLGWFTARCWRFARPDRVAGGIGPIGDLLDAYAYESGTACSEHDLAYWQLLAHCRWAVIALEQAERHVSGRERSLELALTGRLLSALELTILNGARPALSA